MSINYFFDIPVYRVSELAFNNEFKKYLESKVYHKNTLHGQLFREQEISEPVEYGKKLARSLRSFGGPWRFNEIVGYIRLYFIGTQVRGEYFAPDGPRIKRSNKKIIELLNCKLVPEIEIAMPISNETIMFAVNQYIKNCKNELVNRFIDADHFCEIGKYIDWVGIYRNKLIF